MRIILLSLLAGIIFAISAPASANMDGAEEARPEHYAAERPETTGEALKLLEEKTAAIDNILSNEKLSGSNMEAIHEASYFLEASVDRLREAQKSNQEEILDMLDEAVQAIHYASENHEEDKTREWFEKLKNAAKEVQNVF